MIASNAITSSLPGLASATSLGAPMSRPARDCPVNRRSRTRSGTKGRHPTATGTGGPRSLRSHSSATPSTRPSRHEESSILNCLYGLSTQAALT
jgi:hypothetical protein